MQGGTFSQRESLNGQIKYLNVPRIRLKDLQGLCSGCRLNCFCAFTHLVAAKHTWCGTCPSEYTTGALSTYACGAATALSVWGTFSAFQTSWASTNSRTVCFSEAPQPHPQAVTIPTLCLLPMRFRSGTVHCLSSHGWLVSLAQCLLRVFTWWHATTPFFFSASRRPRCGVVHPCRGRLADTALIPLPSFYSTNVKGWSCCVFCDPIGVPRKWWQGRHHSLLMFSASLFWCLAYAWE